MKTLSRCSMWTAHSPEEVFAQWADPESWPRWDAEVRSVSFEGKASVGARGKMRPAHGPEVRFRVTVYEQDHVFTDVSSMPGASLTFEHVVAPNGGGSTVTVEVRIEGWLGSFWARVIGPGMADAAQTSIAGLIAFLDATRTPGVQKS